jgi:hypothetical protein
VLGDLNIGSGAKLSAALVADLTASIPRDVVISAQQQWLPNLAAEMANRRDTSDQEQSGWSTSIKDSNMAGSASPQVQSTSDARQAAPKLSPQAAGGEAARTEMANPQDTSDQEQSDSSSAITESTSVGSESPEEPSGSDEPRATPSLSPEAVGSKADSKAKRDPQACIMSVFGQCLMTKGAGGQTDTANPEPDGGKEKSSAGELPLPMQAGLKEVAQAAQPEGAAGKSEPQGKGGDQTDDLLFPTDEELRAMKAGSKGSEKAAQPKGANAPADAPADSGTGAAEPQTRAAPVISIESDVDPESWAEYGGWYRQDYAIFYRPTGHKDKFNYSWLFLTGPQAPKGDSSPAAAVFDFLTSKDAQGSCTKCHSVDDIQGKGRVVNFSPPSVESKQGRFTNFIHEPHFGILENRGCLTCHNLEKGRPYLKSYEQGNPQNFVSNFGAVKTDLCQTCHTSSKARQDCLLCHKYHVNGVITPIMNTKIPIQ